MERRAGQLTRSQMTEDTRSMTAATNNKKTLNQIDKCQCESQEHFSADL